MSFDDRAKREAAQAHASVRRVNPMTQLNELKHEAKTRRRTGAVLTMSVLAVLLVGVGLAYAFREARQPVVSPVPSPATAVRPELGQSLEPGRYSLPFHGTTAVRAELTLTEPGWSYADWDGLDGPDGGLMLMQIANIYIDPCGFSSSAEPLPAGYSPAQLVAALETQTDTTVSTPTNTTVGGYPALRVDVVESTDIPSSCTLWTDEFGFKRYAHLDDSNPLWIVDVAGTTLVIDAMTDHLTPQYQEIVDSLVFTGH
jgi:hypothetical protein